MFSLAVIFIVVIETFIFIRSSIKFFDKAVEILFSAFYKSIDVESNKELIIFIYSIFCSVKLFGIKSMM
jgi:hypothetical protein